MAKYVNFYENISEASMRLKGTVVCYKGEPYFVISINDHADGKFRIYMDKMDGYGVPREKYSNFPSTEDFHPNGFASAMDKWMESQSYHKVVRKYMSSAGFNKFRPFPLGNMNDQGEVVYVERTPTRNTVQGLRENGVIGTAVSSSPKNPYKSGGLLKANEGYGDRRVRIYDSASFVDTVTGSYPSYKEVVDALRDPNVANTGCAFDREFSVLRGPVRSLCLCYQTEGVGFIQGDDLVLSSDYRHLYEQIQELNVFRDITVSKGVL